MTRTLHSGWCDDKDPSLPLTNVVTNILYLGWCMTRTLNTWSCGDKDPSLRMMWWQGLFTSSVIWQKGPFTPRVTRTIHFQDDVLTRTFHSSGDVVTMTFSLLRWSVCNFAIIKLLAPSCVNYSKVDPKWIQYRVLYHDGSY